MNDLVQSLYKTYLEKCAQAEDIQPIDKALFDKTVLYGLEEIEKKEAGDVLAKDIGQVHVLLRRVSVLGSIKTHAIIVTHDEFQDAKVGLSKPLLDKVISGGQTGVDQAALIAAKQSGIDTSGWVPKGLRTLLGREEKLKQFNVVEHESEGYAGRTYANVRDADATLRLAFNFETSGTKLTRKAIAQYRKPYMDVDLGTCTLDIIPQIREWIITNNIKILNVAGNSHVTNPDSFGSAFVILHRLFSKGVI